MNKLRAWFGYFNNHLERNEREKRNEKQVVSEYNREREIDRQPSRLNDGDRHTYNQVFQVIYRQTHARTHRY